MGEETDKNDVDGGAENNVEEIKDNLQLDTVVDKLEFVSNPCCTFVPPLCPFLLLLSLHRISNCSQYFFFFS